MSLTFTISREKLSEGLAAIAPALAAKPTLPILSNILFKSTDKGLRLSATDLDITVHYHVAADVETEGSLTVPAKKLLAIAKELPPRPCKMNNGGKDVRLVAGESKYRLLSLPEEEFPGFPEINFRGALHVRAGDLRSLVSQTAFAVSKEESRPMLNGVLLQVDEKNDVLRFVATDGHRLALAERRVQLNGMPLGDVILPPRALQIITRLTEADDEIELAKNDGWFGMRAPNCTVFTRMIEGPYPNYLTVIPKGHVGEMRADRVCLLAAVKRMVPIASDGTHRIRLCLTTNSLALRAETPDVGDAQDKIPVQYDGPEVNIGCNAGYLIDILNVMDDDEVRVQTRTPETAITLKPFEREDRKGRYQFILMPLRLVD